MAEKDQGIKLKMRQVMKKAQALNAKLLALNDPEEMKYGETF